MDNYQALTRMCLNNWHYISQKVLSFHKDINFFTGHSGSGKSTVLDALQVVLYADTNGRNFFNKAAKEDSDRTLIEYLRGMKSVGENGVTGYLRNQNFSSTIVLELEDTKQGSYQCVGVVFDVNTSSNDVNRLFFRHTGPLLDSLYRTDNRVMTSSEVRNYLREHFSKDEIDYGRTNEAFRSKLYDVYLGGLDERKFISLFKRAIPFKMDMKLEDFVKEYICLKQDIHIEAMQESVTQYIRLKRRLEEIGKEISCLEQENEVFHSYMMIEKKKNQMQYNLNRLELEFIEDSLKTCRTKNKVYTNDLEQLKERKKELELLLEQLKAKRDDVIIAMERSGYRHLEEQLDSLQEIIKQKDRSRQIYQRITTNLKQWEEEPLFPEEKKWLIAKFEKNEITKEELEELKEQIGSLREVIYTKKNEAEGSLKECKTTIQEARAEWNDLKKGKKVYPSYLLEVKKWLEDNLEKKVGKPVVVEILADLIEIKNERWRNAIEGYMGNHKFSLIVEPDYITEAIELYKTLDPKKYHKIILVDTKRASLDTKKPKEHALCEELVAKEEYVTSYLNSLLGSVVKCDKVSDLTRESAGITSTCILYQGYRITHLNPKNYTEFSCIGTKAMEARADLLEEQIRQLTKQCGQLEHTINRYHTILSYEKLEQETDILENYQLDMRELISLEQVKNQKEEELEALKQNTKTEWETKKTELEQSIKEDTREKDEIVTKISNCEYRIVKLKEEMLSMEEQFAEKRKYFVENEEKEQLYQQFLEEKEKQSYQQKKAFLLQQYNTWKEKEEEEYKNVISSRETYLREYSYRGFSLTDKENKEYENLLHELKSDKLNEFVERANHQAKIAVNQFKTDFIYKIRDAIKEAIQQKDDLNKVLNKLDFGKDRYHLVIGKSKGEEGKFYDMFMDENLEINPSSLGDSMDQQINFFSMEHEHKYNSYMNELLDLFMPFETLDGKELEEARANLEKYADYRTYLSFDMEQRVEGMPVMRLSKMLSKNSGGEGQNPLYVALLASFAQLYRIAGSKGMGRRPTLRLVVLDEAFSKMDGEKVGSCIGLIRKLGFQAIISATNDKIQNYVDNVDKTFVFANPNKTSISIQEFEKDSLLLNELDNEVSAN